MPEAVRKTVLVVDDDHSMLSFLGLVLKRDYDVTLTESGLEAVSMVLNSRPDVILCDIRMPTFDGFWVMEQVFQLDASIPIILHSGYEDPVVFKGTHPSRRPFAFLVKGYSLRELRNTIRRALNHR